MKYKALIIVYFILGNIFGFAAGWWLGETVKLMIRSSANIYIFNIYRHEIAPPFPIEGQLWCDSSFEPCRLNIYVGKSWVVVNPKDLNFTQQKIKTSILTFVLLIFALMFFYRYYKLRNQFLYEEF